MTPATTTTAPAHVWAKGDQVAWHSDADGTDLTGMIDEAYTSSALILVGAGQDKTTDTDRIRMRVHTGRLTLIRAATR